MAKDMKRTVWAMHTSHQNGERSITLHSTERECWEEIASVYDIDTDGLSDKEIDHLMDEHGVWVTICEATVPEGN
jgi:hypothetical protein